MARFFREKGVTLRFIEFMDVGTANDWNLERVVPAREILERISREMPLEPIHPEYFGEVAKRYRYVGSDVEIGFVTSVTQAFCSSCTRIRLTADGKLVTCLFAETGEDVRALLRSGASDEELVAKIRGVWERRADHYSEIRLANTKKTAQRSRCFTSAAKGSGEQISFLGRGRNPKANPSPSLGRGRNGLPGCRSRDSPVLCTRSPKTRRSQVF